MLIVQLITGTPFWQGTADVVFSTKAEALAALKKYNYVQLDGKPMKIEVIGINIEAPASAIFSFA
jgi:THO complex subunit 4